MALLRILLLLSCCLSASGAGAQHVFRGRILGGGLPLELATVSIAGSPLRVSSDVTGRFQFSYGKTSAQVTVSYVGYSPVQFTLQAGTEPLIRLQPQEVSLQELTLATSAVVPFRQLTRVDGLVRPVINTQELLRTAPGLIIAQHAGGGKAEQIFLRGFDSDHGTDVAVNVDGMPVNMVSHAHGQGYADAHFVIPETVSTVDFAPGPYGATQGNFSTAGQIDLSTYRTLPASRVQLEAGRFGTARALVLANLLRADASRSAYVAGEYYYTNGPTLQPQDFHRINLFAKYHTPLGQRDELTVSASTFGSSWDASGQIPQRAVDVGMSRFGAIDPTEGGNTSRQNLNLLWLHRNGSDRYSEHRFYYTLYDFNLYSNFTFFLNDPVRGDGINQRERRDLLGLHSRFVRKRALGNGTLRSTWGTGIRYDAVPETRLQRQQQRTLLEDLQRGAVREANAFAYTAQQWRAGRWLLEGGLRVDGLWSRYRDDRAGGSSARSGGLLQPKLSVQYEWNAQLQLVAKGGKGFHSNDARVLLGAPTRDVLPAAWGADLGLQWKPAPRLFFGLTAWTLFLEQEFVYVGDEGIVEPSGRTLRRGVDLQARWQAGRYWFVNVNLNATRPRALDEPKGADYIPLAPVLSSNGGIFFKHDRGLNGSLSYRYLRNRPANEDNSIVAHGYFVADAALQYTAKRFEAGVVIENLFDAEWNEAQFATESRLRNEAAPVNELHFTPGNPFAARLRVAYLF
ncbi:TonB-dependent receptor [Flaviaesturariibacter amylovorans]|uniref:TonB-dependent receptor n=1 Tax=Flaviaesturariibacter amylovorans TaxID=1084520 RepID=A0ABP8H820_9BACT